MIEILESRIAPAALIDILAKHGSVIVKVHGNLDSNDSLVITGLGDGRLLIDGTNGETFTVNGVAGTGPQTISGITHDVTVDLGKGDDTLTMANLQLAGKLTLKMGAGDNTTTMAGAAVGGAVSYTGGKGADTLGLGGGAVSIGGALTFTGSAGANALQISATNFGAAASLTYHGGKDGDALNITSAIAGISGALTFLGSAGANTVTYAGGDFQLGKSLYYRSGVNLSASVGGVDIASTGGVQIGGAFTYINPTGSQVIKLAGESTHVGGAVYVAGSPTNDTSFQLGGTALATGKVTVASSGGHLSVELLAESLNLSGALTVRGAKAITVQGTGTIAGGALLSAATSLTLGGTSGQLLLGGALSYKSNSALDNATTIQNAVIAGVANFNLRTGKDNVLIEGTRFLKALVIHAGTGSDTINIETSNTVGESLFAGRVSINLGSGADTLTAGSANANDKMTALQKFVVTGAGGGTVSLLNGTNVFVVAPVVH